jgi:UDP-N-acetylmuramyl pentapeptide phosphotransferase/UDP-N-acetylglucosamine-1-phosphate transferase
MDELEVLIPIMGIIWPFLALIIFLYLHYTTKNRISMALIESGRDASILRRPRRRGNSLKLGIVAIMGGLGLLVGSLLDSLGMDEDPAYFSAILIFVGIGLVGYYLYEARQLEKEAKKAENERVEELV